MFVPIDITDSVNTLINQRSDRNVYCTLTEEPTEENKDLLRDIATRVGHTTNLYASSYSFTISGHYRQRPVSRYPNAVYIAVLGPTPSLFSYKMSTLERKILAQFLTHYCGFLTVVVELDMHASVLSSIVSLMSAACTPHTTQIMLQTGAASHAQKAYTALFCLFACLEPSSRLVDNDERYVFDRNMLVSPNAILYTEMNNLIFRVCTYLRLHYPKYQLSNSYSMEAVTTRNQYFLNTPENTTWNSAGFTSLRKGVLSYMGGMLDAIIEDSVAEDSEVLSVLRYEVPFVLRKKT